MDQIKEIGETELKQIIEDGVGTSGLAQEVAGLKSELASLKSSKAVSHEERAEKSAEFIKDLATNGKKTITTGTSSFGYTIPTELASAIYEKKDKIAKIARNAFTFQLAGNFQLPTEATAVTAYWVTTEADSDITESNPTTGKADLTDHYLAARVRIPRALLNTSAINIEQYVSRLASRQLVSKEETAFVAGDGNGQPTGFRSATITDIAQDGASLAYNDVVNLFYAVPEQYRKNATFLTSTMGMKALRKIKDEMGLPIFNVTDQTVFGRPVLEVTDIPENLGTSANETEIYFGDLQDYWIKRGESMQAEIQPVTGRLQVDLFVYESVDGILVNAEGWRKLVSVK